MLGEDDRDGSAVAPAGRAAVVVFACDPRIEAARKPLVGGHSVAVHAALLADTVERVHRTGADLVLAWRGDEGRAQKLRPRALLGQRGRGFGERLRHALADVAALGYDRVAVVGADCPALGPADVEQALAALDGHDAFVGRALDGGANVLALCTQALAKLDLDDLPWETDRLYAALVAEFRGAGLTLAEAAVELDDVDDIAGLERYLEAAPESRLARLVRRALEPAPGRERRARRLREPLVLFGSSFLKSPPDDGL